MTALTAFLCALACAGWAAAAVGLGFALRYQRERDAWAARAERLADAHVTGHVGVPNGPRLRSIPGGKP